MDDWKPIELAEWKATHPSSERVLKFALPASVAVEILAELHQIATTRHFEAWLRRAIPEGAAERRHLALKAEINCHLFRQAAGLG